MASTALVEKVSEKRKVNKKSTANTKKRGEKSKSVKSSVKSSNVKSELVAVVRVRGTVKVREDIKETLKRLKLTKPNHCVVVPKNDTYMGMIKKAKDYITWGEIDSEAIELLNKVNKEGENLYRLHPPVKGFEKGGINKTYNKGGVLGYRGKDIVKLLERMTA